MGLKTGLYIHIPFCKSRCYYCGFYSTTLGAEWKDRYVDALRKELEIQSLEGMRKGLSTVYLGGGTPSQLSVKQLEQLFEIIENQFSLQVLEGIEVTMEVNPDDVTEEFIGLLRRLPVNRVSMGIQTFSDGRLRFLHRRHTSRQALTAIERLHKADIENISIDLMFGFPNQTLQEWQVDIDKALCLNVEHISAYSLMYEECTPLFKLREKGAVQECDEEVWRDMYALLMDKLTEAGYEHYEISNFARPGYRSKHNSGYWNGTPYLGIGAAAHSYDGNTRSWNVADVNQYITSLNQNILPREVEYLSEDTKYNDLITTSLRTKEGVCLSNLEPHHRHYLMMNAKKHIANGLLNIDNNHIHLTREGLFVSDDIMSDLMRITTDEKG